MAPLRIFVARTVPEAKSMYDCNTKKIAAYWVMIAAWKATKLSSFFLFQVSQFIVPKYILAYAKAVDIADSRVAVIYAERTSTNSEIIKAEPCDVQIRPMKARVAAAEAPFSIMLARNATTPISAADLFS